MLLLSPSMNVNAINHEGLNPLDIAKGKAADKAEVGQIIEVLIEKGATRSATWYSMEKHKIDTGNERSFDIVTLAGVLVATVTFAAVFTMPGGIVEEETEGIPGIARFHRRRAFEVFIVSDSCAFFASVTVVLMWMILAPMQQRIASVMVVKPPKNETDQSSPSRQPPRQISPSPKLPHGLSSEQSTLLLDLTITAIFAPSFTLTVLIAAFTIKYRSACTHDEKIQVKKQLIGIVVFVAFFIIIPLSVVWNLHTK
eukprot:Gb_37031 [translate_table: standard]